MMRRLLVLVLCFVASACAAPRWFASPADYADYRQVRALPTVAERVSAAVRYLERHPDGAFREEVSRFYERVEPLFYEANADSLEGTSLYLWALPNGPHSESAAQRRAAFVEAAREGARLLARGAELERRLARAAQSREDVLTAYASWVRRLVDFDAPGRPVDSASAAFRDAWSQGNPPRCSRDRCTKLVELNYELEVGGKPEAYECVLEISLLLDKGNVVGATVAGPDLFARLGEAQKARPSLDEPRSRAAAIDWATQFTEGATQHKLPRERCAKEPPDNFAMLRQCDGITLAIIPKQSVEDEDRVVIRWSLGL